MAEIIEVTDLSAPGLEAYARLTEAQLRNRLEPEKGVFIAESPKVIRLALAAGCQPLSLLMERKKLPGQGAEIMEKLGPDSPAGRTAAVMLGSTETTFYTVSVYFAAAGVRRTRHAIPAALVADLVGFLCAGIFVRLFFRS